MERSRDYHDYKVDTGALRFVEPTQDGRIVSLDLAFDEAELEEFCELIEKVNGLITNLSIPDTSKYPPTMAGVLAFEADIRDGKY